MNGNRCQRILVSHTTTAMDKRATAVNSRLPGNFDYSTPLPRCQAENHGTWRFPPWGNGKGVFFFRLSVCCPLHGYAVACFSRSALPQTLLCGKAERNPCTAVHGIPDIVRLLQQALLWAKHRFAHRSASFLQSRRHCKNGMHRTAGSIAAMIQKVCFVVAKCIYALATSNRGSLDYTKHHFLYHSKRPQSVPPLLCSKKSNEKTPRLRI